MHIIWSIIIGFIVGVFARAIMPGKDPMGFIMTTLLGIGGALLGKFIGQSLGHYKPEDPVGFLMSLLGALIVLFIYNRAVKKSAE